MTELKPWGRFKMVSKDPAEESDHIYFYQSISKIGRNPTRADIVLDMLFVSGVHCVVLLEGKTPSGEPIVKIQDMSRNGIYVNDERVGKSNVAQIRSNFTVHFTKPGLVTKGIPPTVYKFEILKSGLTPENDRLRAERDRASARPPPAAGVTTPATMKAGHTVTTTQLLTGKKHKRSGDQEEIEIEVTSNISATTAGTASPSSSSVKRRRTGDRDDDDHLLSTTTQLQKSNQNLRQKLKDASEREVDLKLTLSHAQREVDTLKDQLEVMEERKKQVEDDLVQKEERLADREQEVDRIKEEKTVLQSQVAKLKVDLESARGEAVKQATMNDQLKAEREKLDTDMAAMTSQLESYQAKVRQRDEQIKNMYSERRVMETAMDSVQTRTEQVEEGKRGVNEENTVLKARLTAFRTTLNGMNAMWKKLNRQAEEDDHTIIAQELEELQRHSDNSILSSEQSQPGPTQENYCADTQPEEGDFEQTLDQDAALAQAGPVNRNVGPFAMNPTKISFPQNMSSDLLEFDQQQPISTDISSDETPAADGEGKSSLESTVSAHSLSAKTPPPPPLLRAKLPVPVLALAEELEETKGNHSDDEHEDGNKEEEEEEEVGKEDDDDKKKKDGEGGGEDAENVEDDDDAEETALQEEEEEDAVEAVEDDKENTPVMAAEEPSPGKAKPPQPPAQQSWLQTIVSNDGDKSEQISASEGGGLFDDETQLSDG